MISSISELGWPASQLGYRTQTRQQNLGSRMSPCRLSSVLLSLIVPVIFATTWPVPYKRYDSRPATDPFCKAGVIPFCPTGYKPGYIPKMDDDDTIEIFELKAPVWEFRFGKLLADFNIIHDAIGFRSQKTGVNLTMEWYELFQLFNCTWAHVIGNETTPPLWCNQGAACVYPGIDDKHWKQNGTLALVGTMTGAQFNNLSDYILWDNHTGLYYETWRVRNSTDPNSYAQWFTPYDCASFVIRIFQKIGELGGKYTKEGANYTYITLISDEPRYVGNDSTIFGPNGSKPVAADIRQFYSYFQAHQPILHFIHSLIEIYYYVFTYNEYYFYYNSEYWYLPMKAPHIRLTYEYVPFLAPSNHQN